VTATVRLSRLLALVPWLLARPGVPVEEAAAVFGISPRQLVADLELLFVCGLPGHLPDDLIEAEFDTGHIYLRNADTIARPLRLGPDEALTLLVGLRTLADVPGLHDRDALGRTIAKLERAAGDAAAVSSRVTVAVEAEEEVTTAVRQALADGRRLHLRYYVPGRDELTERDVDPMRLLLVEGRSYVEGWCHRAEAVRLFRVDRIEAVQVLDAAAALPAQARERDVDEGLFQPSPGDVLVTLELTPAGRWVADYYPCERTEELPDGGIRVHLRTPDTRWVRRLALRLGVAGRVLAPASLAAEVQADAQAALEGYPGVGGGLRNAQPHPP
jgi:proteasome accessory factor C